MAWLDGLLDLDYYLTSNYQWYTDCEVTPHLSHQGTRDEQEMALASPPSAQSR